MKIATILWLQKWDLFSYHYFSDSLGLSGCFSCYMYDTWLPHITTLRTKLVRVCTSTLYNFSETNRQSWKQERNLVWREHKKSIKQTENSPVLFSSLQRASIKECSDNKFLLSDGELFFPHPPLVRHWKTLLFLQSHGLFLIRYPHLQKKHCPPTACFDICWFSSCFEWSYIQLSRKEDNYSTTVFKRTD